MKNSTELKTELDAANAKVSKLFNASMRSGKGPSDEYKAAYKAARAIWRQWSDALDVESGRQPAFATAAKGGAL